MTPRVVCGSCFHERQRGADPRVAKLRVCLLVDTQRVGVQGMETSEMSFADQYKAQFRCPEEAELATPQFIADPYPTYARFRERMPIAYLDGFKAWFMTRQDDVRAVVSDGRFARRYDEFQKIRMGPEVVHQPYFKMARDTVLFMDAPRHQPVKKLLIPRFGRRRAEEFKPRIREITHQVIDTFIEDGETDISGPLSREVPLQVISAILGVPREDQAFLLDWIEAWGLTPGNNPLSADELKRANDAAIGFETYFRELVRQRTAQPGDDFVSELLALNRNLESPLDEFVLVSNIMLLYFGGQDTQQKQVGICFEALDSRPDQLAWLKEDPHRVWECTGELMRHDPVGQFSSRVATEDLELSGVQIKAGDLVMISWGAANRDPEKYERPDELDLKRDLSEQDRHLTFGAGQHACAGTSFALITVPMMIEALYERIPQFEIDRDNVVRRQSNVLRGFERLPIRWNPASVRERA